MLISNVHKSIIVMNFLDTRLSRNVFEAFKKLAARVLSGLKPLGEIPIKHCCSCFKHYVSYHNLPCTFSSKCTEANFSETSRVKLDDFTSSESWTILTRKMVVQIASKYHVKTSADVMLGTLWRIVRKRRLKKRYIALLAPLTMKVVKTKGKRRVLECTSFPRSKKSVSLNKIIDPNITSQSPGLFSGQNSPTFDACYGRCLLLLLRIRSVHLEILGFPMGGAYSCRDIFVRFKKKAELSKCSWYPKRKFGVTVHFSEIIKLQSG